MAPSSGFSPKRPAIRSSKRKDGWITLPKVKGRIPARIHRDASDCGDLKSITLSKAASGRYYAALLFDDGKEAPVPAKRVGEDRIVGLDLGLDRLATLSTGEIITNPRLLRKAEKALKRRQRELSRKERRSKNRKKARVKLARAHERLARVRADHHHKLSRRLIDENQVVAVETLSFRNMMANRRLSKAIGDAGWFGLVAMLDYKARKAGKRLIKVDRWLASSKLCSCCGEKNERLTLKDCRWTCAACGMEHDRDINAAANIRRRGIDELRAGGLRVLVCGGERKTTPRVAAAGKAENTLA